MKSRDQHPRRRDSRRVAQELPAGDNPLYRRTFVGRENEVRQLQQAFDAALSGQGGLVMVVGEPGIGKTALCEQLATYVALRGGKALVGHCYEEGSLSLPYLAFVEAMRSYVLAREPDGLRSTSAPAPPTWRASSRRCATACRASSCAPPATRRTTAGACCRP